MFLLFGVARVALAQTGSDPSQHQSLFTSLVPDAAITVHKHPMGADMVEITMRASGYPGKLLESQIQKLGAFLKSDPRGVQTWDYELNPDMHFTKATFAVDGIIDRKLGAVRLNPIAKAFAGAPQPWTIHSLEIQFQGEIPTGNMIQVWPSKASVVEGRFENTKDPRMAGIEFRIQLLSQDPSKMDIPEPGVVRQTPINNAIQPTGTDWTTVVVFIVAAVAIGALVYSLLLKGRPKSRI